MKTPHVLFLVLFFAFLTFPVFAADDYTVGPDSKPQPGVPQGDVLKFSFADSKIFPGTRHDYWVYVPKEYTPEKPACVYINQDGIGFEALKVFDNLIFKKEMPVTIGVFVNPGVRHAANTNTALDRFNRSYEYDGLGDNYVRFLLEELLPAVEKLTLPDGRAIHLSHSGNDRAIGGLSSGGICAFTAAWERPAEFSRVVTAIGTFVDLRGGGHYPSLIRKFEPKPIRVFLQDGTNDLNIYGGDWWMANQTMERALTFAGYEVNHVWGDGGHSGKQAAANFPDIMRWLWKDWPQPVTNSPSKNPTLTAILMPGENWQPAFETNVAVHRLVVSTNGQVSIDNDGGSRSIVSHAHNTYFEAERSKVDDANALWLKGSDGQKRMVDGRVDFAAGLALSPDQTLLYVADGHSHWVYSYVIQPDGSLADKQQYYWLHVPDTADDSGAAGMAVDTTGRLYVATRMGIQICDQAGRVQCILPPPAGVPSEVCFGGANFDTLYAVSGGRVFKRKLYVTGANSWDTPTKPAAPKL